MEMEVKDQFEHNIHHMPFILIRQNVIPRVNVRVRVKP